jgi:hypothetical protein
MCVCASTVTTRPAGAVFDGTYRAYTDRVGDTHIAHEGGQLSVRNALQGLPAAATALTATFGDAVTP